MKKKMVLMLTAVALIFGISGFFIGTKVMNDTEEKVLAMFSEDVKEVRQGKLAGAMVAISGDEALSEAWEELCSDVLRTIADNY